MKGHSWLIILTVALSAIVSYASAKSSSLPMADDPMFNKMLAPTKDNAHDVKDNTIEDYAPVKSKRVPLAQDPRFNKMLPVKPEEDIVKVNASTTTAPLTSTQKVTNETDSDEYYEEGDEDLYDDDESDSDDSDPEETTVYSAKDASTSAPVKVVKISANKSKTVAPDIKLKPITPSAQELTDNRDTESDSSSDEDDDSDVLVNVASCPRDCICSRRANNYLVASCSRLDAGIQKFSREITDLEVMDVPQQFPIVLSAGFFKNIGLQHVSSIKIVNSFIENVHKQAFEGLDDLYSVNLKNSGINFIHPDTFAENKKLRILTLAGNMLSAMQQNASPFAEYMLNAPSVEELDLSSCNLNKLLPTAFDRLENVVFINLATNELQELPAALFKQVDTIEELDLSSNNITVLPKNIFNGTSLAILNLKYNNIESKLDFGTDEIQKLDLSFNKIVSVSNTMFGKMPGLTSLILKGNSIKKIQQTAFYGLKNLRQIDLSFNNLEQISSQIFLRNRELDIIRLNDNNGLTKLPLDGFESETGRLNVFLFDASNCDISELGDNTFANMPKLNTLNLAWNNIEQLSKEFFRPMTKLVELNLNNNLITEFDDLVFVNNRNLKKLNLAGNPLTKLSPRLFLTLRDLTELDISNCDLVEMWSEPMSDILLSKLLKNLKMLNVSNNNIVHARHTHFATMEHLEVVDLSNNHLHCDEGFHELIKWLAKRNIKPGSSHIGFNAELRAANNVANVEASKVLTSWAHFENETCAMAHPSHAETPPLTAEDDQISNNKVQSSSSSSSSESDSDEDYEEDSQKDPLKPADDFDDSNDSDDSDDDDDDNDDDYDEDNNEIEIDDRTKGKRKDGLYNEEIDVIKDRINKLEEDILNNEDTEAKLLFAQYRYMIPIFIILFSVLAMSLLIVKIVILLKHRRGERYRQALLASKNSIIYQKLSEEINTPQTPKFHRYSPISQV